MSLVRVSGSARLASKALFIGCLALVMLIARTPAASAIPVVSGVPSSSSIFVGDIFTVDFWVGPSPSAADDINDLFLYQFGISYDATRLSVLDVLEGSFLSSAGGTSFIQGDFTSTPGFITSSANALSGIVGASGSGSLLSVQFKALAAGKAIAAPVFDLTLGDGLYDSSFGAIPFTAFSTTLSISQHATVPEPATLLSFGLGAAIWGASRRRRRAS